MSAGPSILGALRTGLPASVMKQPDNLLRLGRRYDPSRVPEVDVPAMLREQSLRGAVLGGILASLILSALWVYGGLMFDRFFPWFSVVQGFFVGRAVRHFGSGLDWRFPALAAAIAVVAAFVGSFVCALSLTAREFDTPALSLVGEISWYTVGTFASREFGIVGSIYAGMAAAVAATFAARKLNRYEAVALLKHRQGNQNA